MKRIGPSTQLLLVYKFPNVSSLVFNRRLDWKLKYDR
jgi:hypothetical protein